MLDIGETNPEMMGFFIASTISSNEHKNTETLKGTMMSGENGQTLTREMDRPPKAVGGFGGEGMKIRSGQWGKVNACLERLLRELPRHRRI